MVKQATHNCLNTGSIPVSPTISGSLKLNLTYLFLLLKFQNSTHFATVCLYGVIM